MSPYFQGTESPKREVHVATWSHENCEGISETLGKSIGQQCMLNKLKFIGERKIGQAYMESMSYKGEIQVPFEANGDKRRELCC